MPDIKERCFVLLKCNKDESFSGDGPSAYHTECFWLKGGKWKNELNMTEKRAYAAVVQTSFQIKDHEVKL